MSANRCYVVRGNARNLPLADASVDLIVTSPPYFGLRSYQDGGEHYAGQVGDEATPTEFLAALWGCTKEWKRVLKQSGSLWVNLGDKYVADNRGSGADRKRGEAKHAPRGPAGFVGRDMARQKSLMGLPWRYALGCIDTLGLILRAEVIWSKANGMPEPVTDRVRRAHEQWFHFTLTPRYYADVDAIREPHGSTAWIGRGAQPRLNSNRRDGGKANPAGKAPGSVWVVASEPLVVPEHVGTDHFAAFPTEFPRRITAGWCPPGGVVLDPFGGTGTTALVASTLGRTGISVDLSHDYSRLARWRTADPGERARAMQVEKSPVQVTGQADLFGDVA